MGAIFDTELGSWGVRKAISAQAEEFHLLIMY